MARAQLTMSSERDMIFPITAADLHDPATPHSTLAALRQIFFGQRRCIRFRRHNDPRNSPAAGSSDRLNAVDATRDRLSVALQRIEAPQVRDRAEAIDRKFSCFSSNIAWPPTFARAIQASRVSSR
jgi:hypothetical protein